MKGGLVGTLSTAVVAGFAAYLGTYYYQNPQASLGDTYRRLRYVAGNIIAGPYTCISQRGRPVDQ